MTIKEFKIQYALGTISYKDKIDIADNTTSKEMLTYLSRDEDWYVRALITKNRVVSKKILMELSKDEDWGVKSSVASNKNTPTEILTELSKDKNRYVKMAATTNARERKSKGAIK